MFTTSDAQAIINASRGTPYPAWTPHLAAFTANPTDAGSLTSELAGSGYARQVVNLAAPTGKATSNAAQVAFSAAAGVVIAYIGLVDALTVGVLRRYALVAGARAVTDASTTTGSPTLTSATAAFVAGDVGKAVSAAGVPAGTTITSVQSGTSVTLSANATATAAGVAAVIGGTVVGSSGQVTVAVGQLTDTLA